MIICRRMKSFLFLCISISKDFELLYNFVKTLGEFNQLLCYLNLYFTIVKLMKFSVRNNLFADTLLIVENVIDVPHNPQKMTHNHSAYF